jgi:hypothetical protein
VRDVADLDIHQDIEELHAAVGDLQVADVALVARDDPTYNLARPG